MAALGKAVKSDSESNKAQMRSKKGKKYTDKEKNPEDVCSSVLFFFIVILQKWRYFSAATIKKKKKSRIGPEVLGCRCTSQLRQSASISSNFARSCSHVAPTVASHLRYTQPAFSQAMRSASASPTWTW